MNAREGLLLIGHGTRDEIGTRQFLDLAAAVARRLSPTPVRPAFLELQQPSIEEAVADLTRSVGNALCAIPAGVRRSLRGNATEGVPYSKQVIAVPLLLFAAGHAKQDIPRRLAAAAERNGVVWTQTPAFGCEPAILELSHHRFLEAVTGRLHVPKAETCLLLVGRGSRDESATAELQEFARWRQQAEGGIRTEIAFLAMARPTLEEQLARIAAAGFHRVMVQPHLLFQGELAASLRHQVQAAAQNSRTEWLVTPLLADLAKGDGIGTKTLADVICERYRGATIRVVAPAGEG